MTSAARPSPTLYKVLVTSFLSYAIIMGYYAATRPSGTFYSPFSWHPLLMTVGMVGCMGTAVVTKKMGGYTNTKNHGLLANLGVLLVLAGLYAIYINKEAKGKSHFTTIHGKAGIALIVLAIVPGLAGAIFLHPDFGVDKQNKLIRMIHRTEARIVLSLAWITAFMGYYKVTQSSLDLVLFGLPLLVLFPFTFSP